MIQGLTIPLADQTLWFLFSIVVGAVIIAIYALLHCIGRINGSNHLFTALWDVAFFLITASIEFGLIIFLPQNRMWWFHILGQIICIVLLNLLCSSCYSSCRNILRKKNLDQNKIENTCKSSKKT